MRIISDFHDYYDTAMAYGIDKTVVFQRNKTKEPLCRLDNARFAGVSCLSYHYTDSRSVREFLVNIAGKNFLGYRIENVLKYGKTEVLFFYEAEPMIEYVSKNFSWRYSWNPWHRNEINAWGGGYNFSPTGLRASFEKANVFDDSLNIQHSLPLFVIQPHKSSVIDRGAWFHGVTNRDLGKGDHELWENPCLKDIQFYKVMDAFSVYQELDMFISGVLPRAGAPTVEISDKVRAEKHGMDKWSFRKKVR